MPRQVVCKSNPMHRYKLYMKQRDPRDCIYAESRACFQYYFTPDCDCKPHHLSQTLVDRVLESLDDGDHTSLVGYETQTERVGVVESCWPGSDDTAVGGVILGVSDVYKKQKRPSVKDNKGRRTSEKVTYLELDQLQCVLARDSLECLQLLLDGGGETRQVDGSRVLEELVGRDVFRNDKVLDGDFRRGDPCSQRQFR